MYTQLDTLDSRTKCNMLSKPDLHIFAKLFEDRLERGLEAQGFSGREIGQMRIASHGNTSLRS